MSSQPAFAAVLFVVSGRPSSPAPPSPPTTPRPPPPPLLGRRLGLQLLLQPAQRHVEAEFRDLLDAREVRAERAVELVEVTLVLYERHPREIVELVERRRDHVALERIDQRQILFDRHRQ